MRRGTTPTHIFETDIDLTDVEVMYITYTQHNKPVLTKELDDITVEPDKVTVTLTQEDTLRFCSNDYVSIQIRARFPDDSAIASEVIETSVDAILKNGVI